MKCKPSSTTCAPSARAPCLKQLPIAVAQLGAGRRPAADARSKSGEPATSAASSTRGASRTSRGSRLHFDRNEINALATATITPSALALGRSIASAADVASRLDATPFELIVPALAHPTGAQLRAELEAALSADEFVTPLGPALESAQQRAISLLAKPAERPVPAPDVASPSVGVGRHHWTGRTADEARRQLDELEAATASGKVDEGTVVITIDWTDDA